MNFGNTPNGQNQNPQIRVLPRSFGGTAQVPAPFLRRFCAAFIDGIVFTVLSAPISYGFMFLGLISADPAQASANYGMLAVQYLLIFIVHYGWQGWFYKNKGATPGKMVMGLKLVHSETGAFIGYVHNFAREFFGKMIINSLTLGIGYLFALFRSDKRGLHDLVCKTQVLYQPKK